VTGWFALTLIVAVVVATAAIFAAGRKAGIAAEATKAGQAELASQKDASDVRDRMLEAGAAEFCRAFSASNLKEAADFEKCERFVLYHQTIDRAGRYPLHPRVKPEGRLRPPG
jgi:hypothetical protein